MSPQTAHLIGSDLRSVFLDNATMALAAFVAIAIGYAFGRIHEKFLRDQFATGIAARHLALVQKLSLARRLIHLGGDCIRVARNVIDEAIETDAARGGHHGD